VQRLTRRIAALTAGELRGLLSWLVEHQWQRDAIEGAEGKDFQPLGLFAMKHASGEQVRITAAYLIRVHRPGEGTTRPERTFVASIYLAADLRTLRVHIRNGGEYPRGNRLAVITPAVEFEEEGALAPIAEGLSLRPARVAPSARQRAKADRLARASPSRVQN
jgi:hypothetical protein